ncbi:MAG: ABC transporter ATP-binding protein [candidate division Zixibacteria bacterium]|nr:ABC transporter ATP-binding protein [candidate division Zixibacteria bacterium]
MMTEINFEDKAKVGEVAIGSREAFLKLIPLLRPYRGSLIYCFILLAAAMGLSLYWPVLLKQALDIDIKNGDFRGLIITASLIGLSQGITLLLQYIQRIRLEIVGQSVMVDLKRRLFHHILALDVAFFDKNPVGRLLARVESDTESLRMLFTNTVVLLIGDLFLTAGVFVVMFYYSWRLALILATLIPAMLLLLWIYERITTPHFLDLRKTMAEVTATLTEFLQGMSIIQIFHRGDYARAKLYDANRLKFRNDIYVHLGTTWFFNVVFLLQYVMISIVLYCGIKWSGSGDITVGTIGMFIILIWRAFDPIYRISEQMANVQKAVAGAKRIFALLANNEKLPDALHPVEWKRLKEGIRFDHVWFSYKSDNSYALQDVTFEIPAGRRVALAGVTGGGKTTVISLLLRFYDPQKGKITVDGIDIRTISKEELRRRFALVLQDIFLFPGDIRANIALEAEGITEEQIMRAAATVEADRFVRRLPKGYSTEVSEKGANFSRGERQLLSFARALVVNPDLLILDEATSSVDPETERTIQESLRKLMQGRTSLIIAHRLSTILDADQILVIRRGEVIERGTHTELILQNGYYSKLFHLQFKNRNGVIANVK